MYSGTSCVCCTRNNFRMNKVKRVKEGQAANLKASEGALQESSDWWNAPGGSEVCELSEVGYQRGENDEQDMKVKDHWADEDRDGSADQQLQQGSQQRQRRRPRRVHRNKNTKQQKLRDTDSKKQKQDIDNDNNDEDDDDDDEEEEDDSDEGVEEDGKSNNALYETEYRDKIHVKKRMKLNENWTTKARSRKK